MILCKSSRMSVTWDDVILLRKHGTSYVTLSPDFIPPFFVYRVIFFCCFANKMGTECSIFYTDTTHVLKENWSR